jgi:uncharacterized SAM-binding protein YcdF (DUF218 family)
MSWDRVCRLLGLASVVFFLVTAFSPLAHLLDLWAAVQPQPVPSHAIVVLAQGISPFGILGPESALPTHHAIALYRQGLAPLLVFLGGAPGGGRTEAEVRAELARLQGIPSEAILTEARADTTREEAALVKLLLQSRGVRTILLVTNSWHLMRARPLFERAGFTVHPAPLDTLSDPDAPENRLAMMRGIVRELLAWVYYRAAGYV